MDTLQLRVLLTGCVPQDELGAVYRLMQKVPEFGVIHRDTFSRHIRENRVRGTLWGAYVGAEVVGAALISSRSPYLHLARHGESIVTDEHRGQRIGTAFFFAQLLQVLLEGRREVEISVINSMSPWMSGSVGCDRVGFLPTLGYALYGTYPARTRGFRDITIWGRQTVEIDSFIERLPVNLGLIELVETDKVRETFKKNIENYRKHNIVLADQIEGLVDWIHTSSLINILNPMKDSRPRLLKGD